MVNRTYKIILHQVVGGIMSQMSGNGFKAGAVSAGLNEALQKELGKYQIHYYTKL